MMFWLFEHILMNFYLKKKKVFENERVNVLNFDEPLFAKRMLKVDFLNNFIGTLISK